jgi:hypothetical protein
VIGILASIGLSACLGSTTLDEITRRWQRPLRRSYRLSGRQAERTYEAALGPRSIAVSIQTPTIHESWETRPDFATHTFTNGFIGRAAPWRVSVQRSAVAVLTHAEGPMRSGTLHCLRSHRRYHPYFTFFDDAENFVGATLNQNTLLPESATISGLLGSVELREITYRTRGSDLVPSQWTLNNAPFSSNRIWASQSAIPPRPKLRSILSHPVKIPLEFNRLLPEVGVRARIDGFPARLLLDSGTNVPVFSAEFARRIAARVRGMGSRLSAYGASNVEIVSVSDYRIGSLRFAISHAFIAPTPAGYDGEIGLDFFAQGSVRIDPTTLTIAPRSVARDLAVSVDTYDGVPAVLTHVNGRKVVAFLDTGLPVAALMPASAKERATPWAYGDRECQALGLFVEQPTSMMVPDIFIGSHELTVPACVTWYDAIEFVHRNGESMFGLPFITREIREIDYNRSSLWSRHR